MKTIIALYFLTFCSLSYSQPSITWQRTYDNGSKSDNEGGQICKSSGNFLFVGFTNGTLEVIKINNYGDIIWNKIYSTLQFAAQITTSSNDGGCVMSDYSNRRVKIDSNGVVVWDKLRGNSAARNYDISSTTDGGYIICGSALNNTNGYVLKIDSIGEFQWEKFFPSMNDLIFKSIIEAHNSGYIFGGYEGELGSFDKRAIIIRSDVNGNEIWRKYPIVSVSNSSCNSIRKYYNDYITVGGSDTTHLIKLDTSGNIVKVKKIPRPDSAFSFSFTEVRLEVDVYNNIIHYRNQSTEFGNEYFANLKKLDSSFNILVEKNVKIRNSIIRISSCLPLQNGDLLFGGFSLIEPDFHTNFYGLRTDNNLNFPPLSISTIATKIPRSTGLIKNYPNPFNGSTKIRIEVDRPKNLMLKIYDSSGQEVITLFNKKFVEGTYEVEWEPLNESSGVYYVQLLNDQELVSTLKLFLVK